MDDSRSGAPCEPREEGEGGVALAMAEQSGFYDFTQNGIRVEQAKHSLGVYRPFASHGSDWDSGSHGKMAFA